MNASSRQYLEEICRSGEEVYDADKHVGWQPERMLFDDGTPVDQMMMRLELSDGRVVYVCTDDDGVYYLPPLPVTVTKGTMVTTDMHPSSMTQQEESSLQDSGGIGYHLFTFLIIGAMLFVFFGLNPMIQYCRRVNDPLDPLYHKNDEYVDAYNKSLVEVKKYQTAMKDRVKGVWVYTNDTSSLTIRMAANFRLGTMDAMMLPPAVELSQQADAIEAYLGDIRREGFFVSLKTGSGNYHQMQLSEEYARDEKGAQYRLSYFRHLSEQEINAMRKANEKQSKSERAMALLDAQRRGDPHPDSVRTESRSVFVYEKELEAGSLAEGEWLRSLFMPKLDLRDSGMLFYFSPYRQGLTREAFELKVKDFQKMFLTGQEKHYSRARIQFLPFEGGDDVYVVD